MATNTNIIKTLRTPKIRFDFNQFIQDHVTASWYQTLWLFLLTFLSIYYTIRQFNAALVTTTIVVLAWVVGITSVIWGELQHKHTKTSRWLQNGLFSSITNSFVTLLLVLIILAGLRGIWGYAVVRATFDPAITAPEFRTPETGASWGVVWGARKLLATGTLEAENAWRVWASLWFIVGLSALSALVYRSPLRERLKPVRFVFTASWLLSPVIIFIFLAGMDGSGPFISIQTLLTIEFLVLILYGLLYWQRVVKFRWQSFTVWVLTWPILYVAWRILARTEVFPLINVNNWGGFLFTMIISVFSIVASFPLGVALALGRRSSVRGIPAWITWPTAIGVTLWGVFTSTPELLEGARNNLENGIAFWPLLILVLAFGFQQFFKGNVVAAASTIYIEVVRGVPLITVLFMAIIMAPLFFPAGFQVKNAWAVLVAFSLFTAAYLAENVRGGLQAIPKGQYEAADALGLNTLQKMRFIILPQALRAVIPAIVGLFIGVFKDSSLVAVVGLFDLFGITNAITGNPQWLGLRTELYLFAAFIYFIGSFAMSSYSRRLEAQLGVGVR